MTYLEKCKLTETEGILEVPRGWVERRMKTYCLMGTEVSFGMMTKLWKQTVVMVGQHCKDT